MAVYTFTPICNKHPSDFLDLVFTRMAQIWTFCNGAHHPVSVEDGSGSMVHHTPLGDKIVTGGDIFSRKVLTNVGCDTYRRVWYLCSEMSCLPGAPIVLKLALMAANACSGSSLPAEWAPLELVVAEGQRSPPDVEARCLPALSSCDCRDCSLLFAN